MFTGIIRHLGTVISHRPSTGGATLTINVGSLAESLIHGSSVAVSGVCLTVAKLDGAHISFDVIAETLRRTTLGGLQPGDTVNLESSLRAGDPIDGHFVQGHVDGTAELTDRDTHKGECVLWFRPKNGIGAFLIPKGSVAIDGVSLTIAVVRDGLFSVALIPTTLNLTTLGRIRIGDTVNIETDIISRTIVHHLKALSEDSGVTMDLLKTHGFA